MSSILMPKGDKQVYTNQDKESVLSGHVPEIKSEPITSLHVLKPESGNVKIQSGSSAEAQPREYMSSDSTSVGVSIKRKKGMVVTTNKAGIESMVKSSSGKHDSGDASKALQEKTASKLSNENLKIVGKGKKNAEKAIKISEMKSKALDRGSKKLDVKDKLAKESTKHKVAKLEEKGKHHGLDDKLDPSKKAIERSTSAIGDDGVLETSAVKKHKRSKESTEVTKSTGDVSLKTVMKKRVLEVKKSEEAVQKKSEKGGEDGKDVKNESNQEIKTSLNAKKKSLKALSSGRRSHISNENKKTSQKKTDAPRISMKIKVSTAKDSEETQALQSEALKETDIPDESTADVPPLPKTNVTETSITGTKKRKRSPEEQTDGTQVQPKKKKQDVSLNTDDRATPSGSSQKAKKKPRENKLADVGTPADTQESDDLNAGSSTSGDCSTPTSSDPKSQKKRQNVVGGGTQQPLLVDDRLPEGWKRQVVQRQGGASMGKYDVYIFGPNLHKFRSRKELAAFIEREGMDLQAHNIDFSVFGKDLATAGGSAPKKSTKKSTKMAKVVAVEGEKPPKRSYTKQGNGEKLPKEQVLAVVPSDIPPTPMCSRSVKWTPPRSPYNLIQENLFHNPWKMLVATILLNKSLVLDTDFTGSTATPIIYGILRRWPTPESIGSADEEELSDIIKPLGLHKKRAISIKRFSGEFLSREWKYPNELHGIGKYGNDSYRMFCIDEWRNVQPTDVMLNMYKNWLTTNWTALSNNTNYFLGFEQSPEENIT